METPSSPSETSDDELVGVPSDERADELYNKMLRGEPFNDREQAEFNRTFAGMD